MIKNLPTMQETCVQSLGPEDPLEKGMATHSRGAWWATVHGLTKSPRPSDQYTHTQDFNVNICV